jgi:hypothetical protein
MVDAMRQEMDGKSDGGCYFEARLEDSTWLVGSSYSTQPETKAAATAGCNQATSNGTQQMKLVRSHLTKAISALRRRFSQMYLTFSVALLFL